MTSLVDIPACSAYHLPTPTSSPLLLSSGDLSLILIPPTDPTDKHDIGKVVLSVGSSSFPLSNKAPVQKVQAKEEHPTYAFSPLPLDGSEPVGQVRITLQPSTNQGEWEATEILSKRFQEALHAHALWNDTTLFVNDEWETGGETSVKKGWGESFAGTIVGASYSLADKLTGHTDSTSPVHPSPPSDTTVKASASIKKGTNTVSSFADTAATTIGGFTHAAGAFVASKLPESVKLTDKTEQEKSELRKAAEGGWEQVTFAAKGVASAATTVGGAIGENAHRAVEHNFGSKAEEVSRDFGQAGANIGSTAVSAFKVTSVAVQGVNVGNGYATGYKNTAPAAQGETAAPAQEKVVPVQEV